MNNSILSIIDKAPLLVVNNQQCHNGWKPRATWWYASLPNFTTRIPSVTI